MSEKGDSLTRIRGMSCHGCFYFLYVVSVLLETPGDQPGAGKAYSIQKGTVTLYIESKTNVIGYRLCGFVPRVSHKELITVWFQGFSKSNLPRG